MAQSRSTRMWIVGGAAVSLLVVGLLAWGPVSRAWRDWQSERPLSADQAEAVERCEDPGWRGLTRVLVQDLAAHCGDLTWARWAEAVRSDRARWLRRWAEEAPRTLRARRRLGLWTWLREQQAPPELSTWVVEDAATRDDVVAWVLAEGMPPWADPRLRDHVALADAEGYPAAERLAHRSRFLARYPGWGPTADAEGVRDRLWPDDPQDATACDGPLWSCVEPLPAGEGGAARTFWEVAYPSEAERGAAEARLQELATWVGATDHPWRRLVALLAHPAGIPWGGDPLSAAGGTGGRGAARALLALELARRADLAVELSLGTEGWILSGEAEAVAWDGCGQPVAPRAGEAVDAATVLAVASREALPEAEAATAERLQALAWRMGWPRSEPGPADPLGAVTRRAPLTASLVEAASALIGMDCADPRATAAE